MNFLSIRSAAPGCSTAGTTSRSRTAIATRSPRSKWTIGLADLGRSHAPTDERSQGHRCRGGARWFDGGALAWKQRYSGDRARSRIGNIQRVAGFDVSSADAGYVGSVRHHGAHAGSWPDLSTLANPDASFR